MARTTINSLGVPAGTITATDLSYPLTTFSSTGIDDNATSTAITIDSSGNIAVTGTVDGRDLATDGTKLDGIEASADVTDATNVTAAGALMDSELTDLAGVKGVTISTLQPKPSEGAFADGDKTKLDGIESGATADQTASEILSAILTVDGTGSGLDADTLDGQEGTYYLNYNNFTNTPTIPTNNNQLTNGAGYITSFDITTQTDSKYLRSDVDDQMLAQLYGGFGAVSTGGTTNWNDSTNARSGGGYTLLLGTATNGPGGSVYYHPFSFEYVSKNGTGNMTQLAIPYNGTSIYHRYRYSSSWSGWVQEWNSANDGSGSGLDADLWDGNQFSSYLNQALLTTSQPTFSQISYTGALYAYESSNYIGSDPRWNQSGYNANEGVHHMYATTGSGVQWGQTGLALYNGGAYVYLTTKSGDSNWYHNNNKMWSAGNDGSGSGLDADTVDGIQGANFLRSDTDDTTSGSLSIGSEIGSRSSSLSVESTGNSSPIAAKTSGYNTVWGILPWSGGQTYISSGIYYDDGAWVHASDNTNNCLFSISGSGANWYASNNSTGSWNLASNVSLWNSSGNWNRALSTNATYNGSTIWHAGNDGSGSGLDADTVDGIQASGFMQLGTSSTSTVTQVFSAAAGQPMLWRDTNATNGTNCNIYSYWYAQNTTLGYIGYGSSGDSNLYLNNSSVGNVYLAASSGNGILANGSVMWHAGNDGSGSGLDADLLDGFNSNTGGATVILRTNSSGYLAHLNWINIANSTGLYCPNGAYFYNDATYGWFARSSVSTSSSIRLQLTSSGTTVGWWYADSSYNQGFLTSAGGWGLKMDNSGNVTATGNVTAYSDLRLKEDIKPLENALAKVLQLRGVQYIRKDTGSQEIGVIAQEVEEVLPEVVHISDATAEDDNEYTDIRSVDYGRMVSVLIEAIKEQQAQIEELKEIIKWQ